MLAQLWMVLRTGGDNLNPRDLIRFWVAVLIVGAILKFTILSDFAVSRIVDIMMAPVYFALGLSTVISWIGTNLPGQIAIILILAVIAAAKTNLGETIFKWVGQIVYK